MKVPQLNAGELAIVNAIGENLEQGLATWIPRSDALRDPEAEGLLVTAVLSGDVEHDDLPPLELKHFSVPQHGWAWELSRETREPAGLARLLIDPCSVRCL